MSISLFFVALVSHLFIANIYLARCYEMPEKVYYDLDLSESLFHSFISKYKKEYTNGEYKHRFEVFQKNLKVINELNKEYEATAFGITSFTDLTPDEFKAMASCLHLKSKLYDLEPIDLSQKVINLPKELDYRKENLVTEVKNQWFCGSCFIFGAIGEIEGQYAKKHNLTSLSEQYPLDCSKIFDCSGGDPLDVMKWLAGTPGALKLSDYPDFLYQWVCKAKTKLGIAKVKSAKSFSANDTDVLKKTLVDHGPLTIGIYASDKFQQYTQGIINPTDCTGKEEPNHAVTLVGYGNNGKEDYWLIKNSWGSGWGEAGYVRLSMDAKCGVGSYVATSEVF